MGRGYYTLVRVTDQAPYVTKLILPVDAAVKNVDVDSIKVHCERLDKDGKTLMTPKGSPFAKVKEFVRSEGDMKVKAAYPSDEMGNPLEEGCYVAVEVAYGPTYPLASEMANPRRFNELIYTRHTITFGELVYDVKIGSYWPDSEGYRTGRFDGGKYPVRYGYYIPQSTQAKKPLLIWLHGAGAGGTDPRITYVGKRLTALIQDPIQSYFGGLCILTPQIETYWLDDGDGNDMGSSGTSIYTDTLKLMIDDFLEHHPEIDRDRVYIGGDSNGGFMTMRMIMSYPGFFAAANPNCEAMLDCRVTDEDIENIKDMPIWFAHAKNDPVVVPEQYVLPTYHRLMAAGAKNVHFTYWDKIEDIHHVYEEENGQPHQYLGHFVWVPVLNDDCRVDFDGKPVVIDGKEVGLFEWMAKQHR